MFAKPNQSAVMMFGVPIYLNNNMMRLKDIQMAYLATTDANVRTTEPSSWSCLEDTQRYIEYLSNPDNGFYHVDSHVINIPNGKRGGKFVCKELAHHYASWLDTCYGAHILLAFSQLAGGNVFDARKTAYKVSGHFFAESFSARFERLKANKVDYKQFMNDVLVDGFGMSLPENLTDTLDAITTQCPVSSALLNDMLSGVEAVASAYGDMGTAISTTLDTYMEDPRMDTLKDFLLKFGE